MRRVIVNEWMSLDGVVQGPSSTPSSARRVSSFIGLIRRSGETSRTIPRLCPEGCARVQSGPCRGAPHHLPRGARREELAARAARIVSLLHRNVAGAVAALESKGGGDAGERVVPGPVPV